MNNAHNSSALINSFKVLWQWLMAKPGQPLPPAAGPTTKLKRVDPPSQTDLPTQQGSHASKVELTSAVTGKPVRVLQVMEAGQSPAQVGRLRISGRMADVCAELDRLAAREALLH